jgi:hypothetical protein
MGKVPRRWMRRSTPPKNLGFFGGCPKWKKVMDDFFHGQLAEQP